MNVNSLRGLKTYIISKLDSHLGRSFKKLSDFRKFYNNNKNFLHNIIYYSSKSKKTVDFNNSFNTLVKLAVINHDIKLLRLVLTSESTKSKITDEKLKDVLKHLLTFSDTDAMLSPSFVYDREKFLNNAYDLIVSCYPGNKEEFDKNLKKKIEENVNDIYSLNVSSDFYIHANDYINPSVVKFVTVKNFLQRVISSNNKINNILFDKKIISDKNSIFYSSKGKKDINKDLDIKLKEFIKSKCIENIERMFISELGSSVIRSAKDSISLFYSLLKFGDMSFKNPDLNFDSLIKESKYYNSFLNSDPKRKKIVSNFTYAVNYIGFLLYYAKNGYTNKVRTFGDIIRQTNIPADMVREIVSFYDSDITKMAKEFYDINSFKDVYRNLILQYAKITLPEKDFNILVKSFTPSNVTLSLHKEMIDLSNLFQNNKSISKSIFDLQAYKGKLSLNFVQNFLKKKDKFLDAYEYKKSILDFISNCIFNNYKSLCVDKLHSLISKEKLKIKDLNKILDEEKLKLFVDNSVVV